MFVFNAKIEETEKLERMLIGRKKTADWLEQQVLQYVNTGVAIQALIIGPRGSGKTHLLKVLYSRIVDDPDVQEKLAIAYMSEDEYGIDTYLDLLVRMFKAFIRLEKDENKKNQLKESIEQLKATQPDYRVPTAEQLLLDYFDGRNLLVLIENLNDIFKGIGEKGQSKWRDFIMKYDNTCIIATSQAIFSDVNQRNKPFFNFFNVTYLKKLTFGKAQQLLLTLAEMEKQDGLVEHLNTDRGKGNLRAIYELTEGNHRLLITFYDFLKAEYKSELSKAFLQTLDKLKPYYESFLKILSHQQQKIIQYLALERIPKTGVDIASNCFIKPTTISKQMSELQRLGYISAMKEGRLAYYEITEPLLRMCIEVNESSDGVVKLFIDFLGNLYTSWKLKEKYLNFKYLEDFVDFKLKHVYQEESKLFLSAINLYLGGWAINTTQMGKIIKLNSKEEREAYFETIIAADEVLILTKLLDKNFIEAKNYWILNNQKNNTDGFKILGQFLATIIVNGNEVTMNDFFSDEDIIQSINYESGNNLENALINIYIICLKAEVVSNQQIQILYSVVSKIFRNEDRFKYGLKLFEFGIRFMRKKDRKALYELTKEERQVFERTFLENKEEIEKQLPNVT